MRCTRLINLFLDDSNSLGWKFGDNNSFHGRVAEWKKTNSCCILRPKEKCLWIYYFISLQKITIALRMLAFGVPIDFCWWICKNWLKQMHLKVWKILIRLWFQFFQISTWDHPTNGMEMDVCCSCPSKHFYSLLIKLFFLLSCLVRKQHISLKNYFHVHKVSIFME